jgi:hypothetical protein
LLTGRGVGLGALGAGGATGFCQRSSDRATRVV